MKAHGIVALAARDYNPSSLVTSPPSDCVAIPVVADLRYDVPRQGTREREGAAMTSSFQGAHFPKNGLHMSTG
jgi:hypothetical protein